jgi:membrane protease YdiL (CAAX protease family)
VGLSRVTILQGTHMDLQPNIYPYAPVPSQTVIMSTTRSASEEARVPESPLHVSFNDARGSSSPWGSILTFLVLANAVTWLACLLLRSTFAAGHLWALFTFVFVTVWSPTVIALACSFSFEGTSGIRNILSFLFRGFSKNNLWYLVSVVVPVGAIATAVIIARRLHSGAPFVPLAALPLTLGLQVFTGAMGEELGWRGFLLSRLERKLSPGVSALVMATAWALWHLPSFYFPGMPQQHMPPVAFLLMVAAFGIFLALLFNRTEGHLVSTMLAHFCLNMGLSAGGAALGSVFIWTLAFVFVIVAIFSLAKLSAAPIRRAKPGDVLTALEADI